MTKNALKVVCTLGKSNKTYHTDKEQCFTLTKRSMKEAGKKESTMASGNLPTLVVQLSKDDGSEEC